MRSCSASRSARRSRCRRTRSRVSKAWPPARCRPMSRRASTSNRPNRPPAMPHAERSRRSPAPCRRSARQGAERSASRAAHLPTFDEEDQPRAPQEMIRVRSELLDSLVNYAGEVSIYRSRLEQQISTFRFNLIEFEQTVSASSRAAAQARDRNRSADHRALPARASRAGPRRRSIRSSSTASRSCSSCRVRSASRSPILCRFRACSTI